MTRRLLFSILLSTAVLTLPASRLRAEETVSPSFEIGDSTFMLNGSPFVIKAAELHYPRIPRPYWDHRIKMCKALGMNTVCLYVFWNLHEPEPDQWDFSGQSDRREFVKLCQANDMKVILRPGPYVCAEWEMGGLPWWLLRKKDISLRERDPYFMERVKLFERQVADRVADLTISNGGPIIMVQVENEYGSYGTDKPYVAEIRDTLRDLYGDVVLFQCDWSSNFLKNGLDDLVWTMNFGTGADIDKQFERLRQERPGSPLMCSEFWSGWFDKWGARHETRSADKMIAGIDEMLSKGISFSLYMTHGGTNWGHWAGANSPGYAPDVTSYDYDAPVNEYGRPTSKYHQLRSALARYCDNGALPPVPDSIPTVRIAPFELTEVAPLFTRLPSPVTSDTILTMEDLGQGFGSLVYRTVIGPSADSLRLTVTEPHDFAQIFLDGRFIGTLDRRKGENSLILPSLGDSTQLDLLVEATGRINFGRAIKDYKGITEKVTLGERELRGWQIYPLPDSESYYSSLTYYPAGAFSPDDNGRMPRGVYRGTFEVETPGDTFLDFSSWGKGLVYVNGHGLGRIWEIGPQQTLYTPGCWLKEGTNEIMVMDVIGPRHPSSEGLEAPILNKLNTSDKKKRSKAPQLAKIAPVADGRFAPGNGWQEVSFTSQVNGRYLTLELLDGYGNDSISAIAEFYLLDPQGNRLPRESWKAVYADSEDRSSNLTAEKAFDLQESTSWTTAKGKPYPHVILIDLGKEQTVSGLQYLPRMETDTPGAIRSYRVYLTPTRP